MVAGVVRRRPGCWVMGGIDSFGVVGGTVLRLKLRVVKVLVRQVLDCD